MTSFEKLQRRIGGFPIEYPAAALMAAAVVYATLALPDWRFESVINATGLPGIVSAAQPPLGTTARILTALGVGALSFLIVWFGLRALDAKPQASDFPAFRAADLHPDAPRRRPILAGAEFGAPADDLPSIEEQIGHRRPIATEPLPSFLTPQTPEPAMRRPILVPEADDASDLADAPEPVVPRHASSSGVEWPATSENAPLLKRKPTLERGHSGVDVAEPRPEPQPAAFDAADGTWPARAETSPPAGVSDDQDEDDEGVGELMARLESGLSRRGSRPVPKLSGKAQEELRRALGDLNRVSGRA